MSTESLNDELNPSDRLSTALQAALREPTPGDLLPSTELREALAARLLELSSQPHHFAEVLPMTTSSKSSWGRVAATLVASGCAAAVAIAILLPKSGEQELTRKLTSNGLEGFPPPTLSDAYPEADQLRKLSSSGLERFEEKSASTANAERSKLTINGDGKANGQPEQNAPFPGIGYNPADSNKRFSSHGGIAGSGSENAQTEMSAARAKDYSQAGMGRGMNGQQPGQNATAPTGGGVAISGPMPTNPMNSAAPRPVAIASPYGRAYAQPEPNQPGPAPVADPYGPPTTSSAAPAGVKRLQTITKPEPRPDLALTDAYAIHDRRLRLGGQEESEKSKANEPEQRVWQDHPVANPSGEQYEQRVENIFQGVRAEPLSTFSIDVDTASYTNCRRFLDGRQLPPTAAVRVEEFINYFRYDYPQPTGKDPFSVNMEMAECPWTPNHRLLRIGLKGKEIDRRERPESNLVFLVDVSGSMSSEDKLPLLRDALHRWVNELSANDRVTICTYAGDAGLRLPTTRGDQKDKLHAAIETLQSGGSTHGSAGIKLAYEQATANFLEDGGVNRVLWATDGDLNVGTTSDDELVELITNKAKTGVFLTVLGVGTGNLKDAKLEKMADKGNGVYAYLDSPKEARKVLIEQMSGTTITIAKDVKIQIEFNPAQIAGYRLIGYENRMLAAEDFANDKKDAGEIGAGHTVTALYEIIPVGEVAQPAGPAKEPLKYQAAEVTSGATATEVKLSEAAKSGELLTLKLRFKQPDGNTSELREFPLKELGGKFTAASKDLQFAGCVAQLAMILRDSQYRGTMTTAAIAEIASATKGEDKDGSRQEFVDLVKRVQELGK